jgi:hypothetical protein
MKLLATIGVLLAAASSPAFAKPWQGDLFITAVTPACESNGITLNSFYRSILKTPQIFSLISPTSAQYYFIPHLNGLHQGDGDYIAIGINSTSVLKKWRGEFSNASQTPQAVFPGTRNLAIKITLNDFAGIAGCTAALAGSIGDRPF